MLGAAWCVSGTVASPENTKVNKTDIVTLCLCSSFVSFLYPLSTNILLIFQCYLRFKVPHRIIHGHIITRSDLPLLNFMEFQTWMRHSNLAQHFQLRNEKNVASTDQVTCMLKEYSY